jgi:hypothetical protein
MYNRLRHSIKITQQDATDAGGNVTSIRRGVYVIPYHHEVTVNRSYDVMTQTAKIVLSRNMNLPLGKNLYEGDNPIIMRNDIVEISAGYHPNMEVVFTGYISRVDSKTPVTILCEDEMYQLKQQISPSFTLEEKDTPTLKSVLEKAKISTIYKTEQISAGLGRIRVKKATKAFLLQTLRTTFGLYSYFIDKTLYVGLASWGIGKEHTILFERDIYENNMEFLRKDDVRIQIRGILIKKDATRQEKPYGDVEGDLRTVYHYGEDIADLDLTCERFLARAKYTGYYGSFTTRLEPIIKPADVVNINSYKDPSRNGLFLVKSVVMTIGVKGGRQKIELERKLSASEGATTELA